MLFVKLHDEVRKLVIWQLSTQLSEDVHMHSSDRREPLICNQFSSSMSQAAIDLQSRREPQRIRKSWAGCVQQPIV